MLVYRGEGSDVMVRGNVRNFGLCQCRESEVKYPSPRCILDMRYAEDHRTECEKLHPKLHTERRRARARCFNCSEKNLSICISYRSQLARPLPSLPFPSLPLSPRAAAQRSRLLSSHSLSPREKEGAPEEDGRTDGRGRTDEGKVEKRFSILRRPSVRPAR